MSAEDDDLPKLVNPRKIIVGGLVVWTGELVAVLSG